jgi:probable rRNA maturation factor
MLKILIQRATRLAAAPQTTALRLWAKQALRAKNILTAELTIRIVNIREMTALNTTYRKKQGATNILSFPSDTPAEMQEAIPHLGDLVICAAVVNREATERGQTEESHWAHIVVHGVMHILGHDHENDHDAEIMEALEIITLKKLGFANPYQSDRKVNKNE